VQHGFKPAAGAGLRLEAEELREDDGRVAARRKLEAKAQDANAIRLD
jgi:hypothetical protein